MELLVASMQKESSMSQFKTLAAPSLGRFRGSISIDQPKLSASATLP